MASSFAWVSVTVKWRHEVVTARQVVQTPWESSFASLLPKIDPKLEEETISHVHISKKENFLDPHVVPVTAPVSLCEQFGCMHVCIFLKRDKEVSLPTRTVASVLMEASHQRVLPDLIPIPEGRSLRADQVLYNDLIGM